MMTLDLFGPAPIARARKSDPATSHAAARQATFAGEHCRRIIDALRGQPGTIYDVAGRIGLDHVQVARRFADLAREHRAYPTDELRRSPTGRMCRVWRLA